MKKLKLDIFKGTQAEISVDKNNNKMLILFNSYYYVEEINDNDLPFDNFSQGTNADNIFISTPGYKILDYNTLILRKVKEIDNKLDVVVVRSENDEIYVIVHRLFVHYNIAEHSDEWVYFKIHNSNNDHISAIKFNYPYNDEDLIIGSRAINNGLIGTYDGNYVKYIQCSNDSDISNMGRLLEQYYDKRSADTLIQNGDLSFLTNRIKSNKIYQPATSFQTADLYRFRNLSYFYDNVYYFDEYTNQWIYVYYENGSVHTRMLKDII